MLNQNKKKTWWRKLQQSSVAKYIACCIIFTTLSTPATLIAQQAWTNYNTSNSGLPENSVRGITIDQQNKKWIATDFGLSVFNDTVWINYNTFNSGIPDNYVRTITIDANSVKWIGTLNGGLTRYDDTVWTTYNTTNSNLPDNQVRSITFDTAGVMWIGTAGGLSKFDGTVFTNFNISNSLLMSDNITDVLVRSDNSKLINTINGGLSFADDTITQTYTITNGGFPDNTVLNGDVDANGFYWFASPAAGLVAYTGGTNWILYNTNNSSIPSNDLAWLDCFQNQIWIATTGSGLLTKTGLTYSQFTTSNSPLPDNYLHCVTADSSGIIWIGTTSAGVVKLTPTLLAVNDLQTNFDDLLVYPNPVTDYFSVRSATNFSEIKITDALGNVVKRIDNGLLKTKALIDVSDLKGGCYFLMATSLNQQQSITRFVKL